VAQIHREISYPILRSAPPTRHVLSLPVVLRHHLSRSPRSDDQREGFGYLIEYLDRLLEGDLEELPIRSVSLIREQLVSILLGQVMVGYVYVVQELKPVRKPCPSSEFFGALGGVAGCLSDLQKVLPESRVAEDIEPAHILVGLFAHIQVVDDQAGRAEIAGEELLEEFFG